MVADLLIHQGLIECTFKSKSESINCFLSKLVRYDSCTFRHCCKVEKIAVKLAIRLKLSPIIIQKLSTAALLHDIGKIAIPKNILQKPGKLTAAEFDIIKQHSEAGFALLNATDQLKDIAEAVLYHHEKFNGEGYPTKIAGNHIPLISRILCIADVYEAITSDRVYRSAMTEVEALQVICQGAEIHFDPSLVKAFLIFKAEALNNKFFSAYCNE